MGVDETSTPKGKPAAIAMLVGFVGAMAPLSTAIHGWMSKEKEMSLAMSKHTHDIRLAYLDRAIDPSKGLSYRQQVLRFLAATTLQEDPVKAWATDELKIVEQDLTKVEKLNDQEKEIREKVSRQSQQLRMLSSQGERTDPQKIVELTTELNQARLKIADLQATKNALNTKSNTLAPYYQADPATALEQRNSPCKASTVKGLSGNAASTSATIACRKSIAKKNPPEGLKVPDMTTRIGYWTLSDGNPLVVCTCEVGLIAAASAP